MEGCPKVAYNPVYKSFIAAYLVRALSLHYNKSIMFIRVIPSGAISRYVPRPRLTAQGYSYHRQPTDINKLSSVIYNPVTNGYVVAAQLVDQNDVIEIPAFYLDQHGQVQSAGSVFSYKVHVKQPNLAYHKESRSIVFVSQVDRAYASASNGKHLIVMRTEPASGKSIDVGPRTSILVGTTSIEHSSISIREDSVDKCFRVCYLVTNKDGLRVPSCSKLCAVGSQGWRSSDVDYSFHVCNATTNNPIVIDYPRNGAFFALWEERNGGYNRLNGYYINAMHFQQSPQATIQTNPHAVYRESDGQVCVSWKYISRKDTCSKVAFRCFTRSINCDDPCSCQSKFPVCGKMLHGQMVLIRHCC